MDNLCSSIKFLLFSGLSLILLSSCFSKKTSEQIPIYGKVKPFDLINQEGVTVNLEIFKNKLSVVNFIFTNCSGQCPMMTQKVKKIQNQFIKNNNIQFVSISIDPANDTPNALKKYSKRFKINLSQWSFLTGKIDEIQKLAEKSFLVSSGKEDLNLHSTRLIVVDKQLQVRGLYESKNSDYLKKITSDIKQLL
tara:strand:+ start:66 stop:644 length:579 start_codon:yes stop_codon:yes gene_type:complete